MIIIPKFSRIQFGGKEVGGITKHIFLMDPISKVHNQELRVKSPKIIHYSSRSYFESLDGKYSVRF